MCAHTYVHILSMYHTHAPKELSKVDIVVIRWRLVRLVLIYDIIDSK